MATNASRDTTTGLAWENKISMIQANCIDLSKDKLYAYLKQLNIDWTKIISRKIKPDEAYFNPKTKEFIIFEKKFQQVEGSADEKPQTCGFKIQQFSKIGNAIGAVNTTYTYIFNNWFKQPKYKDMLDYIKSVNNCDYIIMED